MILEMPLVVLRVSGRQVRNPERRMQGGYIDQWPIPYIRSVIHNKDVSCFPYTRMSEVCALLIRYNVYNVSGVGTVATSAGAAGSDGSRPN